MKKLITALSFAVLSCSAASSFADDAKAPVAPYQGTAQMATAATPDGYVYPVTGGVDWNERAKTSESFKAAHQFAPRSMENNQGG